MAAKPITSSDLGARGLSLLSQRVFEIARCLGWFKVAKICVLDKQSNFLDRKALGSLAVATRDWLSHNEILRECPLSVPHNISAPKPP
jgi:hypothetical protein